MASGAVVKARTESQNGKVAGMLWRRKAGIALTTVVFAAAAFGVAGIAFPVDGEARLIVVDRRADAIAPVAGSVGEIASVAGNALAAGFKASSEQFAAEDPNRSGSQRLAEILRRTSPSSADSADSGATLTGRHASDLLAAAREAIGPRFGDGDIASARIVADLRVPAASSLSTALPVSVLAGTLGLLASSAGAVVADLTSRRRRARRRETRWTTPDEAVATLDANAVSDGSSIGRDVETERSERLKTDLDAALARAAPSASEQVVTLLPASEPAFIVMAETESPAGTMDGSADMAAVQSAHDAIMDDATLVVVGADEELPVEAVESEAVAANDDRPDAQVRRVFLPTSHAQENEAEDIAEAMIAVGTRIILMVETGEALRSRGSVDLVRALAEQGAASMILDLGFDRRLADDLGIDPAAPGLSDMLTGAAEIADIIHRDSASDADVIVWGRDETVEPLQEERLRDLFLTLGAVYDCIVIAAGATSLRSLTALLDEDGAAVVSAGISGAEAAGARLAELAALGRPDALVMTAYPRNLHLIAEAA